MNSVEAIQTYIANTHPSMTCIDITSTLDQKSFRGYEVCARANPHMILVGRVPPSGIKMSDSCSVSEPGEIVVMCKQLSSSCVIFPEGAIDCIIEGAIHCCRCGRLSTGDTKLCLECGRETCGECMKLANACTRCGAGFNLHAPTSVSGKPSP